MASLTRPPRSEEQGKKNEGDPLLRLTRGSVFQGIRDLPFPLLPTLESWSLRILQLHLEGTLAYQLHAFETDEETEAQGLCMF